MQQPMGKKEIEEKIAKRDAENNKLQRIALVVQLITFWPFLGILTLNLVLETYKIIVQEMGQSEKMIWIVTQNFPIFVTWVIVYYTIRRTNRKLGW